MLITKIPLRFRAYLARGGYSQRLAALAAAQDCDLSHPSDLHLPAGKMAQVAAGLADAGLPLTSGAIGWVADGLGMFYRRAGRIVQFEQDHIEALQSAYPSLDGSGAYEVLHRVSTPVALRYFTNAQEVISCTVLPLAGCGMSDLDQCVILLVEAPQLPGAWITMILLEHKDREVLYHPAFSTEGMYGEKHQQTTQETLCTVVPLLAPIVYQVIEYYRPTRRKNRRRRGATAKYHPERQRVIRVDLSRAVGIERRPERTLSDPPRPRGRDLNPGSYNGPTYHVGPFKRRTWVLTENTLAAEEWLDLRKSKSGRMLALVERSCNASGYTVGDHTVGKDRVVAHDDLI